MSWFRVDNRLVHGQVIEGWLPYLDATKLVVINDKLAVDGLQQQIMQLAIPGRIQTHFVPIKKIKALYDAIESRGNTALYLLATCQDVSRLTKEGVAVPVLNVGNIHYGHGKRQLCMHVAVSDNDLECLRALRENGTILDFRSVPTDMPVVEEW
jgi:PTS system mannose-specific IIB component